MIRIIAGEFRHREIVNPNRAKTRPTQDRVREAIFSAISMSIKNRVVLDLFAGSGAYGFEALSRGASKAYFVDNAKECVEVIKETTTNLKIKDRVIITRLDYLNFLNTCKTKFDLVFLDPPYAYESNLETIKKLIDLKLLSDNAIIVAEQDIELEPLEGFKLKTYSYGYKKVGIYRKGVL